MEPMSPGRLDDYLEWAGGGESGVRLMGSGVPWDGYSVVFALPLSLAAWRAQASADLSDKIMGAHWDAMRAVLLDLDSRMERVLPGLEIPAVDVWDVFECAAGRPFPHTHFVLPRLGQRGGVPAEPFDRGVVEEWADGAWQAYRGKVAELVASRLGAKMRRSEHTGDAELDAWADYEPWGRLPRRRCPRVCEARLAECGLVEPIVPASGVSWR
jgi:hypothetical protein